MDQILRFFSLPQGNLVYSIILNLLVFGAFQATMYARGKPISSEAKRLVLGLLFVFLAQLVFFLAAWMAWMGMIDGHSALPPLDRTFALFSLVLIIWMWAFPKRAPAVDASVTLLAAAILVAGGFGLYWWLRQDLSILFINSPIGGYAYYAGLILTLLGLGILPWRRPISWGYGFCMLLIMLAGYLAQFIIRLPGSDYLWLVRIGEMASFILLLALPRRIAVLSSGEAVIGKQGDMPVTSQLDAQPIQSIIDLCMEKSPQQYYQKLTRLATQMMDADVCLLIIPPKTGGQLIIPLGYKTATDEQLDGFTIDGYKMPSLVEAIQLGKVLKLDGGNPNAETSALTREIELPPSAHLLTIPFKPGGSASPMALVLLSNPAKPLWTEADVSRLDEIAKALASAVPQATAWTDQGSSQVEADKYRLAYTQLKEKFDALNAQGRGSSERSESELELLKSQKNLQETVKQLEARNRELEILIARNRPSMDEVEQLRQELRMALADLARVPSTLSKSDQQMLELQLSTVNQLDSIGQSGLVSSLAQEFRQPISSIMGYTDLLLGESVGILGAMQRKFLERVRASTERMAILVKELAQVVSLDGSNIDQALTRVNIDEVVNEALGNIAAQRSEKNIRLRVDLPENLPNVEADKDALQQILSNLLQNACLVTPEDGEISLSVGMERREGERSYLLISVTDQGGGVAQKDIPRVFSRQYKADNPPIHGIGEIGVGLSIVKSLVELLKGRIWVDSKEGYSSTFSCVIPVGEHPQDRGVSELIHPAP